MEMYFDYLATTRLYIKPSCIIRARYFFSISLKHGKGQTYMINSSNN